MQDYDNLKHELQAVNQGICELMQRARQIPATSEQIFEEWETACHKIEGQLEDDLIRVAVVGAIKSGKSTLINAMLSGEYLKRGAGVVTSMVTRLRRGPRLKARLYFKSWQEVNADIQKALALFPASEWGSRKASFDIREASDRQALKQALKNLSTRDLVTNDTRNLNSLSLSAYLEGYEHVREIIGDDSVVKEFSGQQFAAHQDFSGNDTLAFYLKDIALEVDSENIAPNIEIADCQGSDSPNPLHLTMIQDYLLSANLLVYVISSRTGIRQADINFLSMIRRMGFIEHIVFVVNFDFGEHEAAADLNQLVDRIKDDLGIIRADPQVYTFSALYSLFRSLSENLSEKDRQRLAMWRQEENLAAFSHAEEARFNRAFHEIVTNQRYALLFKAPLDRLTMIAVGILKWCRMNRDLLGKGSDESAELIKKIKGEQKRINRVQSMIKSTVEGTIQQVKRDIKKDVDDYLDPRYGEAVAPVIEFVRNYSISTDKYSEYLAAGRFSDALYMVFQEFTHELDAFMAETVNPKIFNFIKTEEDRIKEYFSTITGPYEAMVVDAMAQYNQVLENLGLETISEGYVEIPLPDFQALKREQGLELPPADTTMNYSRAIKTEAIMRFGMQNLASRIKRLFRRSAGQSAAEGQAALKTAAKRMKRETEGGISFQFKNYKENIKFQYLFHLVDAVADHLYAEIMDRFHDFTNDLVTLGGYAGKHQDEGARLVDQLNEMAEVASDLEKRLKEIGSRINM
ncbi:MAG: dynamin family protein [Desulfobacterales bacterium]|nr:dynamin family protein [Desulfobacterales bacterium]